MKTRAEQTRDAYAAAIRDGWLEVGEYTYGPVCVKFVESGGRLRIGKFCSLAHDVQIFLGGEHDIEAVSTYPFASFNGDWEAAETLADPVSATKGDVVIGNDVWIGAGATILSGVTIGDGAVVGARAVVASDVAPYSIVAGNPARRIRWRKDMSNQANVKAMQQIAWWDWPAEKISEALPLILGHDVETFINRYKGENK